MSNPGQGNREGYKWTEQDVDSEYRPVRIITALGTVGLGAMFMEVNPALGAIVGVGSFFGSKLFLDHQAEKLKTEIRNESGQQG